MNNGMWIIRVFLLALFLGLIALMVSAWGAKVVLAWGVGVLVVIVGLALLFRGEEKPNTLNEQAAIIRRKQSIAMQLCRTKNEYVRAALEAEDASLEMQYQKLRKQER